MEKWSVLQRGISRVQHRSLLAAAASNGVQMTASFCALSLRFQTVISQLHAVFPYVRAGRNIDVHAGDAAVPGFVKISKPRIESTPCTSASPIIAPRNDPRSVRLSMAFDRLDVGG